MEFDYVGVIIGDDMRYENGIVVTDFTKRARTDQSLKEIKKLYKENPELAKKEADEIIKNISDINDTRYERLLCILYKSKAGSLSEEMSGNTEE
nr:DNA/RNA helicase domain-containing protein [Mediterraneibacter glycyrrhizinilyticus]